jgi:hypothetical protein
LFACPSRRAIFLRRSRLSGENEFFELLSRRIAGIVRDVASGGAITMKKTALLTVIFVAASYPAIAKHHFPNRDRATAAHSRITCDMVRTYVAQVGLEQARAMAQAAGMTRSEEREAVQCLEKKI